MHEPQENVTKSGWHSGSVAAMLSHVCLGLDYLHAYTRMQVTSCLGLPDSHMPSCMQHMARRLQHLGMQEAGVVSSMSVHWSSVQDVACLCCMPSCDHAKAKGSWTLRCGGAACQELV